MGDFVAGLSQNIGTVDMEVSRRSSKGGGVVKSRSVYSRLPQMIGVSKNLVTRLPSLNAPSAKSRKSRTKTRSLRCHFDQECPPEILLPPRLPGGDQPSPAVGPPGTTQLRSTIASVSIRRVAEDYAIAHPARARRRRMSPRRIICLISARLSSRRRSRRLISARISSRRRTRCLISARNSSRRLSSRRRNRRLISLCLMAPLIVFVSPF